MVCFSASGVMEKLVVPALATGPQLPQLPQPSAQDDAAALGMFSPQDLPQPLAFDHGQILYDYLQYRLHGKYPEPMPV